jgi:hypothetical protein
VEYRPRAGRVNGPEINNGPGGMLGPPGPSVPGLHSPELPASDCLQTTPKPKVLTGPAKGLVTRPERYVPERAPGPVLTVPVLDPTELSTTAALSD